MTTTTRFDHSNCDHAKSGNEGKKARAKCRKAHAAEALAAATKKPVVRKARTPRATATPKPKPAVSKTAKKVEPVTLDLSNVDDLIDAS